MRKRLELAGQKFNRLTVIEFSHINKHGQSCWLCKCDCGKYTTLASTNLKGSTKSCGCLLKESAEKRKLKLTGQKFSRLTVIKFSHQDKRGKTCWKCKCDCGKYTTVLGNSLRREITKSCGCLRIERLRKKLQLPKGISTRNYVLHQHKVGAKKRNLEQALTDEQIIALHKENCHYCGIPPSTICSQKGLNGSYIYNGIDRIDNTMGYTEGNIVTCCATCNHAKGTKTVEEFMDLIKRIHSHLNL